jgi:hypothetical protein
MPCVERAHGGHEAGGASFGSRLARHLLHPFDGVDGFQGFGSTDFSLWGFVKELGPPALTEIDVPAKV